MAGENAPPNSEIDGKNGSYLIAPPFKKNFTEQLKWHLYINGTRPEGQPKVRGTPWLEEEFVDKLAVANRRARRGDLRKNLGNWLAGGASRRASRILMEQVLFGNNNQAYDEWVRHFREAGQIQWQEHHARRKSTDDIARRFPQKRRSNFRVVAAPGLVPHGFSVWTDLPRDDLGETLGQPPSIAEPNSDRVKSIHRLLFQRSQIATAPVLRLSLPQVCAEVEDIVRIEGCALAAKLIAQSYGVSHVERIGRPPDSIAGFNMGDVRVHIAFATRETQDGTQFIFTVRRAGSSKRPERVGSCRVDGLGRVTTIALERDPNLPNLGAEIPNELGNLVWAWYAGLERHCVRTLQHLVTSGVSEMYRFLKSVLPVAAREAVWLYALVGEHGISLTDLATQDRAISSIGLSRKQMEASPLEAAIALIGIRLERIRSFSNVAVATAKSNLVELQGTLYGKIVQDAEARVFSSGTLRALRLAVTANQELGIVAAFPAGDLATEQIIPMLSKLRPDFQSRLERMAEELRFLLGVATEISQ